jgi:hypothetical protein
LLAKESVKCWLPENVFHYSRVVDTVTTPTHAVSIPVLGIDQESYLNGLLKAMSDLRIVN